MLCLCILECSSCLDQWNKWLFQFLLTEVTALNTQTLTYCGTVRRQASCCVCFSYLFGGLSSKMLLSASQIWLGIVAGGPLNLSPAASGFASCSVKSVYLSVHSTKQQKFYPQHFILCLAHNKHSLIMEWIFVQNNIFLIFRNKLYLFFAKFIAVMLFNEII